MTQLYIYTHIHIYRFPRWCSGKESPCQCRRKCKRCGFDPWIGKILWRRAWQPTPIFLPGESHGQKEPGGLQPIESQRVGHNWSDLAYIYMLYIDLYIHIYIYFLYSFPLWFISGTEYSSLCYTGGLCCPFILMRLLRKIKIELSYYFYHHPTPRHISRKIIIQKYTEKLHLNDST